MAILVAQRESRKAGWVGIVIAFFPALGMGLGGLIGGTLSAVLWGLLSGNALVGAMGLILMSRMSSFGFSRNGFLVSLAYGIPLLPHILGHWFLNSVDRCFSSFWGLIALQPTMSLISSRLWCAVGWQALAKSWTPLFLSESTLLQSIHNPVEQKVLWVNIETQASYVIASIVLLGGLAVVWGDEILSSSRP